MGLFKSLFSAGTILSKQKEIEKLITETILATHRWEQAGEPSGGTEILDSANAITEQRNFRNYSTI